MIIRRILRDDWWKVSAYTAVLLLNLIATVAAYPTFQANYQMILNMVPSFLAPVKQAILGAGGGGIDTFIAVNHLFKGANVLGAAAAIILSLGTIVREVEIGTIGLLLSRPVSRARILASFAIVHLAEITLPLLLVTATTPLWTKLLLDEEPPVALLGMMVGAAHAALFAATVYAIALLCAVVFTEQIKTAAVVGGVCVVSFLLYFIEATRPFTLYNLSSFGLYLEVVRTPSLMRYEPFALGVILLVAGGAAFAVFRRRDY